MTAGRVLGVDVGTVRIGIALSDTERMVATPLVTVPGRDEQAAISAIAALVAEHGVTVIVAGLPLDLDGSTGRAAKRTLRFLERLEARVGCTIHTIDERLTSVQAERHLLDADLSRARRKAVVDQVAAALILQSFLDTAVPRR